MDGYTVVPRDLSSYGPLTPSGTVRYFTGMKRMRPEPNRKQIGVRIDPSLTLEAKVLALRTGQGLNDLIEEALKDLFKKYKAKASAG